MEQDRGKCRICRATLKHPIQRGRNASFCGSKCRKKYRKEWRKRYDAQDHVKEAKRKREMENYWKKKQAIEG